MKFRGFFIESYRYIHPRSLKGWTKFLTGMPRAFVRFYLIELKYLLRRNKDEMR